MNVTTTPHTPAPPAVDIDWNEAFCSEGANCFRFGLDDSGRAYIGSTLTPGEYVSDSVEALRALIYAVKAGAADHLL
ncbi:MULTISPECIES: hypothetical protein [Streptomyces]|uniref:DUF397 domain-containing protein n=1 Tax=Streptomyces venezuelae TaxID=54571 RepID=A0A5P2B3A5_STRVZ|nr:hypothetical protein [Streptomyces venezuelae]QES24460.1 hypothetical protein DEJ46_06985 [Streptomyces venezuelae]